MKKNLLGFIALTLALSSCSKSEVVEDININQGLIKFSAISGNVSTKAVEKALTDLQGAGVPVFALTKELPSGTTYTPYFTETLTYSTPGTPGGTWAPSIKRYLRDGAKNEFYSIYPVVPDVTEAADLILQADAGVGFDYTVNDDADEDLLGAAATDSYDASTDGSTGVAVTIPFHHLLSQVNLGVKITNTVYGNVEITGIQFNNVGAKGSYKFNGNATEGKDIESNWTADGTNPYDDFSITKDIITKNDIVETVVTGGVYLPGGTATLNGDFKEIMAASSLMPMPLSFDATSTITFTFKAYDLEGKEVTDPNSTTTGTISLDATNVPWKQGLRYIYVVDFDSWFKNRELKFNVTLSDWENYDWNDVSGAGTGVVDVQTL